MLEASFANPAHDLARAFRIMLDAMARPGRIYPFVPELSPPPAFDRESAAIALVLCDFQTPVWLGKNLRNPEIEKFLRFHTGAPLTASKEDATFAFINAGFPLPDLSRLLTGTHEHPDRSATLVITTDSLEPSAGVVLSGPGIEKTQLFNAPPLDRQFWSTMIQSRTGFPLGIDVFFVSDGALAAIPRSTRIAMAEAR